MNVLREKVAIVTGASSGIGRASAKLFAQEGAKVIVAARRQQELEILVDEIARAGGTAVALAGDVADESFAKALVDIARTRFGGLDIGFNNAGTLGALRATPDVTVDEWDEAMRTNLTSAFLAAKHQIPAMLERHGGALVFTSTFVGHAAGCSVELQRSRSVIADDRVRRVGGRCARASRPTVRDHARFTKRRSTDAARVTDSQVQSAEPSG